MVTGPQYMLTGSNDMLPIRVDMVNDVMIMPIAFLCILSGSLNMVRVYQVMVTCSQDMVTCSQDMVTVSKDIFNAP
jgi:hypothetical protein